MLMQVLTFYALGDQCYQVNVRYDTDEGHQWVQLATGYIEVSPSLGLESQLRQLGIMLMRLASIEARKH
jgi:hypothetical protein